jgi:hypothetical protein
MRQPVAAFPPVVIGLVGIVGAFSKYPRSADDEQPGNRARRYRSIFFLWLLVTLYSAIASYFLRNGIESAAQTFAVLCLAGIGVLNLIMVTDVSEIVSADILEHAAEDRIQDALKNNWTNTAVLAALMFSMVAGYGFPLDADLHLREFIGGKMIEARYGYEWNETVQYTFFTCTCLSFVEYLIAMLLAAIHLMWTEALSMEDMKLYYMDNPLAPAAPLVWLLCGSVWHLGATTILYYYSSQSWFFLGVNVLGFVYLGKELRDVSSWSPKRDKLASSMSMAIFIKKKKRRGIAR